MARRSYIINGRGALYMSNAIVRRSGDVAIVDLSGRLTLGDGCGTIRDTVRDLVNAGDRNILLNLNEVTYVDSAGLGEMASAYTTVSNLGGKLRLLNTQARVNTLLQVTKLYIVLITFSDEATA